MSITLKAARVNVGLTQREAAEKLGITKETLINWEKARTFPSAANIKKIEALYRVKYEDFNFLMD